MLVTATQTCFDGLQRQRVGSTFEVQVGPATVLSNKYLKPAHDEDRVEFDRLCLPVAQRPKIEVKKSAT